MTNNKWLDYAGLVASSAAYVEASKARTGVDKLATSLLLLKRDIANQDNERAFQKWVIEMLYQFNKTLTAVSTSPSEPLQDYFDIISFLNTIEENNVKTASIDGLENKVYFEQSLLKAQQLLDTLGKNVPEIQGLLQKQEQLRAEKVRKAAEEAWEALKRAQEVVKRAREHAANPFFDWRLNRKLVDKFKVESFQKTELLVGAIVATPYDEKGRPVVGLATNCLLITNNRVVFWAPSSKLKTMDISSYEDIVSVENGVQGIMTSTLILKLKEVEKRYDVTASLLLETLKRIRVQMAAYGVIKLVPNVEMYPIEPQQIEVDEEQLMKKYEITFERDKYWFRGYSYSERTDAINYAKLLESKGKDR